jgi:hypothetical protein
VTDTNTNYCGPWVCPYPSVEAHTAGDLWTCPNCGTSYRLSEPVPERWWRNWSAPYGHWRLLRP